MYKTIKKKTYCNDIQVDDFKYGLFIYFLETIFFKTHVIHENILKFTSLTIR